MTIIWAVMFPLLYGALPYGVSMLSRHHNWDAGHPGLLNDFGLISVASGAALLVWVMAMHFEKTPEQGARIGNPLEGPGYVLTRGPYGYCRHPMHVAGILIMSGWTIFYGSIAVLIAATILTLTFVTLAPSEERGIEATLGEEYRRYKAQVPRWGLGKRSQ